jgi:TolA-binding protein
MRGDLSISSLRPCVSAVILILLAAVAGCKPEPRQTTSLFAEETFAVGQRYYLKQDYASAATRFEEYLAFALPAGDEARGRYWLGRCRLMKGRVYDALEQFDRALSCPPDRELVGLVLLARADALRGLRRLDEAEQAYRAIVDRNNPAEPVDVAMLRLAQCRRARGDAAEANRLMAELKRRFPQVVAGE